MATLVDNSFPTLINVIKRLAPDGSIADVVNILSKKNPILEDIPWLEGNQMTGHEIVQSASSLPSGSWRKLNAGIAREKGETAKYTESCGILAAESTVDCKVAELNGNAAAYRASEDKLFMEGMRDRKSVV